MVFSQTFRLDIFVVKSERTMRVLIYLFILSISTFSDPLPSLHSRIPVERHHLQRCGEDTLYCFFGQ